MTTGNKNPGNFANDREKASEAGKKGGQASAAISPTTVKRPLKQVARVASTATAAVGSRVLE